MTLTVHKDFAGRWRTEKYVHIFMTINLKITAPFGGIKCGWQDTIKIDIKN
jgi:hypothetical protein